MKIKIKTISIKNKDFDKVLQLITEVLRTPFGASPYVLWPGDEKHTNFVAYSDNEVVGCLVMLKNCEVMQGKQFAVKESLRNRLIGIRLINFAGEWAKKNGVKKIEFNARLSAVKLYERYGFKCTGESFFNDIRGASIPSIKMERIIE